MALSEFQLIDRFFARQRVCRPDVALAIGDDGALLRVPSGMDLVVTMDTLVAGRHFPPDTTPRDLGHKALAVNLSDLAAMGAEPAWATLSLCVPDVDETWLEQFSDGLFALAQQHQLQLVGGDTVRGPLAVTLTLHGLVPRGEALLRSGARAGDLIAVTGSLGDAGAGLAIALGQLDAGITGSALRERLDRPSPRVSTGLRLRGLATACIDVSDGLAADLGHILDRSGVGATVRMDQLPVSSSLQTAVGDARARAFAVGAGDDYELCFTLPPDRWEELSGRGIAATVVGVIEPTSGLRLIDGEGQPYRLDRAGFDHFGD